MKQNFRPAGFNFDIPASELGNDTWNAGKNVVFRNGFAKAAPGWEEVAPGALLRPLWMLPVYTATTFYWVYAGNNAAGDAGAVGVTDGVTHWDITPVAGISVTEPGDWSGGVLNGVPVFNNGLDAPFYWDVQTSNPCETLPGWPDGQLCKSLRPFKYHLIAMNISNATGDFPDLVAWSAAAEPGNIPSEWIADPANDAGSFAISATTGAVLDGAILRESFVIYKQHATTIMQYIAGQFVFSNRKAFVASGILARDCAAEIYGQHYVLTDGDIIRHNGQEVESIADGVVRDYLFTQLDPDTFKAAHVKISHADKQVWICYPTGGNEFCNEALVYDLVSGKWGLLDQSERPYAYSERGILNQGGAEDWDSQPDTWTTVNRIWNRQAFNPTSDTLFFADYDNSTLYSRTGFTREGQRVPILLQLLSKDFGDVERDKLANQLWLRASSNTTVGERLRVRVGTQDSLFDPIAWKVAQELHDGQLIDADASGRYLSIEVAAEQSADWTLQTMTLDYQVRGIWA